MRACNGQCTATRMCIKWEGNGVRRDLWLEFCIKAYSISICICVSIYWCAYIALNALANKCKTTLRHTHTQTNAHINTHALISTLIEHIYCFIHTHITTQTKAHPHSLNTVNDLWPGWGCISSGSTECMLWCTWSILGHVPGYPSLKSKGGN